MAADSGLNEAPVSLELSDVAPASDEEIRRLDVYIKNAKPNDEFGIDAKTVMSLLKRISLAESDKNKNSKTIKSPRNNY